jgi:hypothetical protein
MWLLRILTSAAGKKRGIKGALRGERTRRNVKTSVGLLGRRRLSPPLAFHLFPRSLSLVRAPLIPSRTRLVLTVLYLYRFKLKPKKQADEEEAERVEQDKPSKKKHVDDRETAAGNGNGADAADAADLGDEEEPKKRSKKKHAPIERVDASVDGIMSGSPFTELQLSERTQKVRREKRLNFGRGGKKKKKTRKTHPNFIFKKKLFRRSPPSASTP